MFRREAISPHFRLSRTTDDIADKHLCRNVFILWQGGTSKTKVGKTEEVVNLRTTMGDNHVGVAWTRHTALVICKPMARVYGLDAALPHMNGGGRILLTGLSH